MLLPSCSSWGRFLVIGQYCRHDCSCDTHVNSDLQIQGSAKGENAYVGGAKRCLVEEFAKGRRPLQDRSSEYLHMSMPHIINSTVTAYWSAKRTGTTLTTEPSPLSRPRHMFLLWFRLILTTGKQKQSFFFSSSTRNTQHMRMVLHHHRTGEFRGDARHGQGIYRSPSHTYEGDWAGDLQHGSGKLSNEDGGVYEGCFKRGTSKYVFAVDRYPPHSSQQSIARREGSTITATNQLGLQLGT